MNPGCIEGPSGQINVVEIVKLRHDQHRVESDKELRDGVQGEEG